GGLKNIAGSMQSFVGGGAYNQAIGPASAIPGGNENFAPAPLSFIGGGQANQTPGPNATIGGGNGNVGAGPHSFIGGGQANVIQGASSVIGGGNGNQAMGLASTIPGGQMNLANGNYSFAAGQQAQATNHGSFVWADSQPFPFASAAVDDWSVRSVGGARFVSAINALGNPTAGVRLPPGGNAWLVLSDRNMKSNFETVDSKDVLERLVSIPIQKWNYNTQDPSIRHIGPMAQDLASAFAVGEDEKYINPSDADGVSMAAIQGLYQMVKERDQRIEQLEARLAAMEAKLNGK
ncbi:MAG TPA: tail fiber domain-containing protein, partial [Armatimonadota bacterium]|nr:tail fiber domain-containing protein [Armatimonadota bacterium]